MSASCANAYINATWLVCVCIVAGFNIGPSCASLCACGFCFNLKLKHWRHFYNQAFWKSKFLSGTEEGIFPGLASIEWRGRAWRSFHMDGKMHHHCPYFTGAVYKCSISRWNCCFSNTTSTSISKSKHQSLRGRKFKLFCWINKVFFCWQSHYIRGSNRLAVRRHHPAASHGSRM